MLETAGRFFKAIFAPGTIFLVMIFVGVSILVVGHFVISATNADLKSFVTSVGTAVLSGGAFMATVKSLQFAGVFTTELGRVLDQREESFRRLLQTEFRKALDDWERTHDFAQRQDSWLRRTQSILADWFSDARAAEAAVILGRYVGIDPKHIPAYYTRCSFDYEIISYDPTSGFYTIREMHDLRICAARVDVDVPLKFMWKEAQHEGQSMKIHSLQIDGFSRKDLVVEKIEDGSLTVTYDHTLTGKKEYRMVREMEWTSSIMREPYHRLVFSRITNDLIVSVRGALHLLNAELVSVGTSDDFTDLLQNQQGTNNKRMQYDKPIFPRQGFMLVFRPQ